MWPASSYPLDMVSQLHKPQLEWLAQVATKREDLVLTDSTEELLFLNMSR